MKAGAAAFFKDINLGLGVEVSGMVSSTLVKLQAIVLAFECVPSLSSVYLFSDSQAALNHHAFMKKYGLIPHDSSIPVLVSGSVLMFLAKVVRLLGIDNAFDVSFGLCNSCWFFLGIDNLVSVYMGV
ncbi:hypothetical protein G9A89_023742 [Geosiphon pyriformis]|nr:hypothetical protein G9A89_023742 [Geosiphon pyriformis]